jgi:hypothetical protein
MTTTTKTTTKFAALRSINKDVARKLQAVDRAIEAARELLREVESAGYSDVEKCAASILAGQLCHLRTKVSNVQSYSMADDAEWLSTSEQGKVFVADFVAARGSQEIAALRDPELTKTQELKLDAELATIGPRVNPFEADDGAGPFAEAGR